MKRIEVTVEVKYLYCPLQQPTPCRAGIYLYLPTREYGNLATCLLGKEEVFGEDLCPSWGKLREGRRWKSTDVVAPDWDDLEKKVEAEIARAVKTLRAVATRYRWAMREKPADTGRKILI